MFPAHALRVQLHGGVRYLDSSFAHASEFLQTNIQPRQVLLWAWHGEVMVVNKAEHTTGSYGERKDYKVVRWV